MRPACSWVVVIANFSYSITYTGWMNDPLIPEDMFVPTVELHHEKHFFITEKEALLFIKNWWSKQEIA